MIKKITIISILLFISYVFYNNHLKSKKELERKFAIENIDDIDKVFLSDRKGTNLILNKSNNEWIINESFKVRSDAITTLLNTLKEIEVQRPVPNSSYNNVIRQLATIGVKVEIYYKNKVKTYTVGGSTSNHLGTYMLMDNSENPYIMHIPGFNGFLSPRYGIQGYELDITKWRDNSIFNIRSEDIEAITLINIQETDKSFIIQQNPLEIKDINGNNIKYNLNLIVEYLNLFSNIECEKFKGLNLDLSKEKHLFKFTIKHNEKTDTLDVYSFTKRNNNKNQSEPNVERMYARLNDGEFMLIQKYVFNKVFISIEDFREKL